MKQKCAMLLPDQTYEQCQAILTPILAIRKILQDSRFDIVTSSTADSKQNVRSNGLRSKRAALGKLRRIDDNDDNVDYNKGAKDRGATPENFVKTSDFFNNIPDYMGDPLGPFGMPNETECADGDGENGSHQINNAADVLKECEEFLHTHRIRSDFFCRYRKAIE